MLICIPNILSKDEVKNIRREIDHAMWVDGNVTAGEQSAKAKHNKQLPENSEVSIKIGNQILDALGARPLFVSAALPLKTFPPLFNRYDVGDGFGIHVDNAIRPIKGTSIRIRTDLSMTLFLCEPDEYDGGELVIETQFGAQEVKLEAGSAGVFPSTNPHKKNEIKSGGRLFSFFLVQKMIKNEGEGTIFFYLDQSIQRLASERGQKDAEVIMLTGIYHNLIRRWADA